MQARGSLDQAGLEKAAYDRQMEDVLMAEPVTLAVVLLVASLLLWLLADSDDDNSGGGLHEPVLIPIPVRDQRR